MKARCPGPGGEEAGGYRQRTPGTIVLSVSVMAREPGTEAASQEYPTDEVEAVCKESVLPDLDRRDVGDEVQVSDGGDEDGEIQRNPARRCGQGSALTDGSGFASLASPVSVRLSGVDVSMLFWSRRRGIRARAG